AKTEGGAGERGGAQEPAQARGDEASRSQSRTSPGTRQNCNNGEIGSGQRKDRRRPSREGQGGQGQGGRGRRNGESQAEISDRGKGKGRSSHTRGESQAEVGDR